MQNHMENARTGSILILPMLLTGGAERYRQIGEKCAVTTDDLAISVKEMFNREQDPVAELYRISEDAVNEGLFGERKTDRIVIDGKESDTLRLGDMVIYRFESGVALACVTMRYPRMELMERICHPGYAKGDCTYAFETDGTAVDLEGLLEAWLQSLGLSCFYGAGSLFLEAYIYNLAVVPERFQTLEEIRALTFRMHLMSPLTEEVEDLSEEDVAYVYAVKDQTRGSYRWGCCVSSQTISYAVADEALNFEEELEAQITDGLPIVALAMYEKYTCLYFGRTLTDKQKKRVKHIRHLKKEMLKFKAYGTVTPAFLSRWYNVRMIYSHLIEFFGVPEAISEISDKLEMLADAQKALEENRTEAVMSGITIFGIVSILDSLLSIYEVLAAGTAAEWSLVRLSIGFLAGAMAVLFILFRGDK